MNARNYADRCSRAMAAGTNYEFLRDDSGGAHSSDWRAHEGRPPAMVDLELIARSPATQKSHVCVQISFPFALTVAFCFARFV